MKLTKDDFEIYGDKVKLEIWLRKHEMDEILQNQEDAEKYQSLKTYEEEYMDQSSEWFKIGEIVERLKKRIKELENMNELPYNVLGGLLKESIILQELQNIIDDRLND